MSQSNEYLLNNALAEDFQQMLRPYCLTQKMLCASKCSIKDNFVLPNSKTYRAFVMFVLCFITYAYFATSWAMSFENNSINTFKDLFKIFKETVEAFALSSNLVQYPVLSYTISTFFTSLVTLQKVIEWTKNAKISEVFGNISVIYILTVAFNIKNFIVVVMFSVACERFYSRLDDIKRNCAVVLDLPLEESVFRKTTKNILRLCDVSSSKMRVCSLFTVDAALPLRLLGLMATCLYDSKEYEFGLRMDELAVKCLLYTDDQLILAPSACGLQDKCRMLLQEYMTFLENVQYVLDLSGVKSAIRCVLQLKPIQFDFVERESSGDLVCMLILRNFGMGSDPKIGALPYLPQRSQRYRAGLLELPAFTAVTLRIACCRVTMPARLRSARKGCAEGIKSECRDLFGQFSLREIFYSYSRCQKHIGDSSSYIVELVSKVKNSAAEVLSSLPLSRDTYRDRGAVSSVRAMSAVATSRDRQWPFIRRVFGVGNVWTETTWVDIRVAPEHRATCSRRTG
ncbi:hypothetical protein EVAR_51137_1 [Eumeta japonica]|uniref:Reverse transcriptase domain-containing protein n=1 Tax=Eumeta variegata TaxID=151549 RepID=A0A4C1YP26_EUMVA|nr:hypothetical protein EVAR_51137_1 [Eumeta japonica]